MSAVLVDVVAIWLALNVAVAIIATARAYPVAELVAGALIVGVISAWSALVIYRIAISPA